MNKYIIKMDFIKLYDVNNSQNKHISNTYDHPYQSLSYILNTYKSRINIPMVFRQKINFIGDYTINYDDISNMPIIVSYYDKY